MGNRKGNQDLPLITRRDLAMRLDVHMQTVTKWERAGLPIAARGGRGRPSMYDEIVVRAWLAQREESAETGGALDLVQERAKKEHWHALLAEQKHAFGERTLLPVHEIEKAWASEVAAVRAILLSSYTNKADRVARAFTLRGIPGVEAELKAIAYDALRELANPGRLRTGEDDDPQEPVAATGEWHDAA